jgi:hypothetical protein
MDLQAFDRLLTPHGQDALQAAQELEPREEDFLRHFDQLCRRYPPELARTALETAILRREACAKFPQADRMYFTRQALEQATGFEIAAYRSKCYRGFTQIADLGCSIGGDALALAQVAHVLGIDRDALRLRMAQANAAALDPAHPVDLLQADLSSPLPLQAAPGFALFFDPARRDEFGRAHSVNDYQPPLSVIHDWLDRFPALGVKISPAVSLSEIAGYDAEVEFISLKGELKEAVLWFGALKSAGPTGRSASTAPPDRLAILSRATLLPGEHTMAKDPGEADIPARLSAPLRFLYEPDPAILRAGLVRDLMLKIDACQLDPEIAYLTCDTLTATPFARAWQVEDWMPFNLKKLRAELRQKDVGEVVVKKRGSPIQPEELIQALRLQGEKFRLVFLTQCRGKPVVIVSTGEITPNK